ncbi:chromosome segregation protein SMC [Sphingomonas sp. MM-1]|uniref:chromosome segregation protein SMC n=1 Tax=Sphingomonas sp. MM-1 TaxID=745310 RepID=UPI0002C045A1|nr:chromosome segregation protein SMC [Sphingomonas sp. MM-1]AGH48252.1 chromosome segregation protein SMC [Sphingomonas sp. MM-1]
MRIRRLKLSGFKSFVEPSELRIEPGLTGIVGPNGCGKSNLLEAIRWAMGESSAKSMRGGGMEDVIFAGTTQRPARDFAEVSILVDRAATGDGQEGEVEIVRRIERGAGSAYRINGRDVRAKDVALLFADAATGAHSPALVSQGRIAAVIAAKPTERRQMLEEAAGIAGLHVRRKDAEQKLRATEANLARLDELLADMDVRANALRRQARAAERYRQLSDQIRLAEARLIYARWREAAAAADAAKAEAAAAEAAVQAAAEAQRAAAAHQAEAVRAVGDARARAQATREAAAEAGHQLTTLRAERTTLESRLAELARQGETLERDRAREDTLAVDASAALARLAEEDKALAAARAGADAEQAGFAARVSEAEGAARDAEVALAHAVAEQAAEQAEVRVAQAALAAARQRLQRAEAERARAEADVAALPDAEPLLARQQEALARRDAAQSTAADATAAITTAEAERDAAAARRDGAESEAAAARAALAALESEFQALTRGLASDAGGDQALGKVRAAPGYERALAAALGDELSATVGPAGKRRWAGADRHPSDPALPAGVEALAAWVEAPAELARRLAQVGVVDADDGAIRLAAGQRLVTRDGRMRRWDGFVAEDVGAAAAERLIRVNRLAAIGQALPPARAAVEQAGAAVAAAQAAFAAARAAIDDGRRRLADAENAMRAAVRDADQAGTAIERLAGQRATLEQRAERAAAERTEAADAAAQAEAGMAALPDGLATARKVDQLRQANDAARSSLADLRAALATLRQRIEADARRLEAVRAESKSWRSRAGDAARRIDEMAKRADAVAKEQAALAEAPARLDARIAALEEEAAGAKAAAAEAREAERVAEDRLRQAERAAAESGEALAAAREGRAGAAARHENQELRRVEMGRISGERFGCPAPVLPEKIGFASGEVGDAAAQSATLDRLTADRERLGPVNLVAETELAELEEARATGQAERDELGEAIHRLRGSIGSLNREGRARLLAAFEAVDQHFRRLFTTLFAGGEAHLALTESDDPLEAGLEIMAQPPGKKLAALTLLSGGEQALTAVALIFALFLTNPAPICVLDEVDAPLDDANIERFCDLLDRMTQETETRYLIVTHNAVTMARMHRLFGVTMVERGVSRLVSVDLGGAERLLAAE